MIVLDDPLSLLGFAVWTLAAGMWPVALANGFLFGACSACCECPEECSKCTHWHNTAGQCNFLSDLTWSYTVEGIGTITVQNVPGEPCTGQGDNSLDIPLNDLPPPDAPATWFNAYFCARDFDNPVVLDDCGCGVCVWEISLTARLRLELDEEKEYSRLFVARFNNCDETSAEMLPATEWQPDVGYGGAFGVAVLAYLNGLNISMTLSELEPCDCGACCDDGCEEDVAEGGCTDWQGVGVTCDPDPCV